MTTIKSYTDLSQSKKLAEILPLESADIWYSYYGNSKYNPTIAYKGQQWFLCQIRNSLHNDVPCWSLAALLDVLPPIEEFRPIIDLDINLIRYEGKYRDELSVNNENLIDACYEMILKLNELNLL